ncbi:MAG: OmpA family protein [Acidimicrobiia bacterium]
MATFWRLIVFVTAGVLGAGCTASGEDVSTTEAEPPATTPGPTVTTGTPTTQQATTTTVPVVPPGPDLLTFAEGALLVEWSGTDSENSLAALQLIDGDPSAVTMSTGGGGPVAVVFKLPAATTFSWFGVPGAAPSEGDTAFFGSVTISGSSEGEDSGFVELARGDLEYGSSGEVQAIVPSAATPVRWVRVVLEGTIGTGAEPDDRTRFEFTEIIGKGVQEERPLSQAFTGSWELAYADRPDARGERLELRQEGAVITGCLDTFEIRGTVSGSLARATGYDPSSDRSSAIVFVADDDGSIAATVSLDNGRFEARTALPPPRSTTSLCQSPEPLEAVCDAPLHINFEVDSAVIRSGSEAILSDIFRVLTESGVDSATIEGHTSTEGSDEYNRDLSQRRAAAVADALVALGFPADGFITVGLGESEPIIFPEPDEAARAINRRVEILCD